MRGRARAIFSEASAVEITRSPRADSIAIQMSPRDTGELVCPFAAELRAKRENNSPISTFARPGRSYVPVSFSYVRRERQLLYSSTWRNLHFSEPRIVAEKLFTAEERRERVARDGFVQIISAAGINNAQFTIDTRFTSSRSSR